MYCTYIWKQKKEQHHYRLFSLWQLQHHLVRQKPSLENEKENEQKQMDGAEEMAQNCESEQKYMLDMEQPQQSVF